VNRLAAAQERLAQAEWRLRESAILALGAVAEGCSAGLVGMAPQIVRALLPVLADPRPLVRSIACWTLGRYCKWLFPRDGSPPDAALLALQAELLDGLLKRVLDRRGTCAPACLRHAALTPPWPTGASPCRRRRAARSRCWRRRRATLWCPGCNPFCST